MHSPLQVRGTRRRPSPVSLSPWSERSRSSSLAACGGDDESPKSRRTRSPSKVYPDYYPAEYQDVVDASKEEGGELVIYSNTSEENWAPIFRDFKKKFPWVEDVSANDLDSDEVFQKILSEQSTGGSPADLVVSNAAVAWADFAAARRHADGLRVARARRAAGLRAAAAERVRDVHRPDDDRLQHRADDRGPDRASPASPTSPRQTRTPTRTRSRFATRRAPSGSPSPTPSPRPTPRAGTSWSGCCRSPAPRRPQAPRWRRSSPVSTWPGSSSAAARRSPSSTTVTALSMWSTPRTAPPSCPAGSASLPTRRTRRRPSCSSTS